MDHPTDQWNIITEPNTLYRHILQRNQAQLLKSIHYVFAEGPLSTAVGRDGDGPIVEDILEDTVDYDSIPLPTHSSPELADFIAALKRPLNTNTGTPIKNMQYNLNNETYKDMFTKSKEYTASSPSGIHYGHYIAALDNELLISVNAIFMQVTLSLQFPLERWTNSVHCMLQKKANPYLTKLRIIQIFEAVSILH